MSVQVFVGYTGGVWRTAYLSVAAYARGLATAQAAGDSRSIVSLSQTVLLTLLNAVDAVDAFDRQQAWSFEAAALNAVAALPLASVPLAARAFFDNRRVAYAAAAAALQALLPQPPYPTPSVSLPMAQPAIPYVGLLEFFQAFAYETPPVGLVGSVLVAQAQACADAFGLVAQAVGVFQGAFPTALFDAPSREQSAAQTAADTLEALQGGPFPADVTTTSAWDQVVALPAMMVCGSYLSSAPLSQAAQQSTAIRYALLAVAQQVSLLLLALARPRAGQVNVAVLRQGETLPDVAARALGDYSLWPEIAALNGLIPPFVAQTPGAGVAAFGQQLVLPSPGTAQSAGGQVPTYAANFLGTDLYVGPVNGAMPAWTGELQTITGYANLAWALGRRLQTTLGTLIYERSYGSRIPPEVGMVQDSSSAGHVAAFARQALLSDPRVQQVLQLVAGVSGQQRLTVQGVVQPAGVGSQHVGVNEVLSPLP